VSRKKKKTKADHVSQPAPGAGNSRGVEAATVAWMLASMTTLACGGMSALVYWFAHGRTDVHNAVLFGQFMHFSAAVTGTVVLILTVVVLKGRRVPPPLPITLFAITMGVLPWLAAIFLLR